MLANRVVCTPEELEFENNDDVITGYIIKPPGYQPGTHHSGIFEIHGGPESAYGTVCSQEMQPIATLGCFAFYTNPHGSASRGVAFSVIRRRYDQEDYPDPMTFTDEVLRRYPDVDPDYLAVMGGSYGGFMTNWRLATPTDSTVRTRNARLPAI